MLSVAEALTLSVDPEINVELGEINVIAGGETSATELLTVTLALTGDPIFPAASLAHA